MAPINSASKISPAVHWNLPEAPSIRARHRQWRRLHRRAAAHSAPRPAFTPAASRRTKHGRRCARPKKPYGGTAIASRTASISIICSTISRQHAKGKTLFAQDLYGGADPKYRIKARVFTELAWHSLFIRQLLIRPERAELASYVPDMTIVDMPSFKAGPQASRRAAKAPTPWSRSTSPARSS